MTQAKRKCPTCGGTVLRKDGLITVGPVTLDILICGVTVYDRWLALTKRQVQLLAFLMKHPDRPIPREMIRQSVWPKVNARSNVVDVYINYLRNKGLTAFIHTVCGKGYMFAEESR